MPMSPEHAVQVLGYAMPPKIAPMLSLLAPSVEMALALTHAINVADAYDDYRVCDGVLDMLPLLWKDEFPTCRTSSEHHLFSKSPPAFKMHGETQVAHLNGVIRTLLEDRYNLAAIEYLRDRFLPRLIIHVLPIYCTTTRDEVRSQIIGLSSIAAKLMSRSEIAIGLAAPLVRDDGNTCLAIDVLSDLLSVKSIEAMDVAKDCFTALVDIFLDEISSTGTDNAAAVARHIEAHLGTVLGCLLKVFAERVDCTGTGTHSNVVEMYQLLSKFKSRHIALAADTIRKSSPLCDYVVQVLLKLRIIFGKGETHALFARPAHARDNWTATGALLQLTKALLTDSFLHVEGRAAIFVALLDLVVLGVEKMPTAEKLTPWASTIMNEFVDVFELCETICKDAPFMAHIIAHKQDDGFRRLLQAIGDRKQGDLFFAPWNADRWAHRPFFGLVHGLRLLHDVATSDLVCSLLDMACDRIRTLANIGSPHGKVESGQATLRRRKSVAVALTTMSEQGRQRQSIPIVVSVLIRIVATLMSTTVSLEHFMAKQSDLVPALVLSISSAKMGNDATKVWSQWTNYASDLQQLAAQFVSVAQTLSSDDEILDRVRRFVCDWVALPYANVLLEALVSSSTFGNTLEKTHSSTAQDSLTGITNHGNDNANAIGPLLRSCVHVLSTVINSPLLGRAVAIVLASNERGKLLKQIVEIQKRTIATKEDAHKLGLKAISSQEVIVMMPFVTSLLAALTRHATCREA